MTGLEWLVHDALQTGKILVWRLGTRPLLRHIAYSVQVCPHGSGVLTHFILRMPRWRP
jgi:hypothetical protein